MAGDDHSPMFQHQLLPSKDYIRLIEVLDIEDGIKCRLTCWPRNNAPPYNAISYTWGDPNDTVSITLNGRRLDVRQNCALVLKQARWHDQSQYHWIDAICINQVDIPEKNDQVAKMADIYGGARRVMACVGDHDNESRNLFATLRHHARLLAYFADFKPRKGPGEKLVSTWWCLTRRHSTHSNLMLFFNSFVKRPYFSRIWIMQELFRGQEIVLCCGTDVVPFNTLTGLKQLFESYRASMDYGSDFDPFRLWLLRRFVMDGDLLYQVSPFHKYYWVTLPNQAAYSFSRVMRHTAELECQDPRDTVYGVLSMVRWEEHQKPILPDYSKSSLRLYIEVMRLMQDNTVNLDYDVKDSWGFSFDPWGSWFEGGRTGTCLASRLGLTGSSLKEVVAADATIVDVIEAQRQFHIDLVDQKQISKIYTFFEGGNWQHGGRPVQFKGIDFSPEKCSPRKTEDPLHCILTDQGRTFLVFPRSTDMLTAEDTVASNISIMKFRRPVWWRNLGPFHLGLVARKHADGQSRIIGSSLIYEPNECILRLRNSPPGWLLEKVYVKTKDGKSIRFITRDDTFGTPEGISHSYGTTRTGEDFIEQWQETRSST